MQSAQSRILEMIEQRIVAKGYEVASSFNYSNLGTVRIYRPGTPIECGSITFDFQDATYSLSICFAGRRIPSQPGREDYFTFYQSYSAQTRFWDALDANLPKLSRGERAPSFADSLLPPKAKRAKLCPNCNGLLTAPLAAAAPALLSALKLAVAKTMPIPSPLGPPLSEHVDTFPEWVSTARRVIEAAEALEAKNVRRQA
jgi:hypothetical protein